MELIEAIILLIIGGIIGGKSYEALQKNIVKKVLEEQEKEKMDKKP